MTSSSEESVLLLPGRQGHGWLIASSTQRSGVWTPSNQLVDIPSHHGHCCKHVHSIPGCLSVFCWSFVVYLLTSTPLSNFSSIRSNNFLCQNLLDTWCPSQQDSPSKVQLLAERMSGSRIHPAINAWSSVFLGIYILADGRFWGNMLELRQQLSIWGLHKKR